MTLQEAEDKIAAAPSFPALREAYRRFMKSLYKKEPDLTEFDANPSKYLIVHAFVMREKSAACQTMKRLTGQVFSETGLPRKPQGKFRGMDGVDIEKL